MFHVRLKVNLNCQGLCDITPEGYHHLTRMLMNLATGRVVVVLEVLVFISSDHGVHPNLLTFAKLRLFLFVWRQIGREIVDHRFKIWSSTVQLLYYVTQA